MKFIIFILIFPLTTLGQNTIGLPDIINYNKQIYKGGLQNWDIKQDKNGVMYFANNEGLLSFDGKNWKLFPLPNKTNVRSVAIGLYDNIYVGGQDEFGYFASNKRGSLEYHSLTKYLKASDKNFGDVWDIVNLKTGIFFRCNNKIFKFSNKIIEAYNAPTEWSYMGYCNNKLYAHDYSKGLMVFENNAWQQLTYNKEFIINGPITAMLDFLNDTIIVTTLKNGIYILSKENVTKIATPITATIEQERVYAATAINNEWLAIATNNNGAFIIDLQGNLIQRFSKKEGLQNKNILSIFLDRQSNLWLGLDNGIDLITYNTAIKRITPFYEDGGGYTSIIFHNNLYMGTTGGLSYVPLQQNTDLSFCKGSFLPVANTTGQPWSLAEINGQLLLAHHEGAFIINENIAHRISSNESGFWNFTPMQSVFPSSKIVSGTYNGLQFINYYNNSFAIAEIIPNFIESCRFVALDNDNIIWVSHPYHGVYKIRVLANGKYEVKLYNEKNGLPSTLENHVYKIKNELLIATEKGIYSYNKILDIFEPNALYKRLIGSISLRYLKEDAEGNIWFIQEKKLGVLDLGTKDTSIIFLPELNNKMLSGFEFIYPVNENNIFIGGERGFFHINYPKYKKNIPSIAVQMRSVKIVNTIDSTLFDGYFNAINEKQIQQNNQIPNIANNWSTIRLEYSTPVFGLQNNVEYSHKLVGIDDNWSSWSSKSEKEYTNLPPRKYTFEIKARNNLVNSTEVYTYTFNILPPWYLTWWAYLFYIVAFVFALFYLFKWQRKKFYVQQEKHEKEQQNLAYLHQLEINKAANELIALRNEKLQTEVEYKNAELASSAMHLVQKSELMVKLKTEIVQLKNNTASKDENAKIKKILKTFDEENSIDEQWELFTTHFNAVHTNFFNHLKEKHPEVSGNEIKLSAYLRMNLSTKEIAQLMNISVRGVEIARYRFRKKLGIATEVNLFDYLTEINK